MRRNDSRKRRDKMMQGGHVEVSLETSYGKDLGKLL